MAKRVEILSRREVFKQAFFRIEEARLVSPPVDRRFRPRPRFGPRRRPWIVGAVIFEAEVKGIATDFCPLP